MGTDAEQFENGRVMTSDCKDGKVQHLIDGGVDLARLMRIYKLSRSTVVRKLKEHCIYTPKGFYVGAKFKSPDRVYDSEARRIAMGKW